MNEDNQELEDYIKELESRMWKGIAIGCIGIITVIITAVLLS